MPCGRGLQVRLNRASFLSSLSSLRESLRPAKIAKLVKHLTFAQLHEAAHCEYKLNLRPSLVGQGSMKFVFHRSRIDQTVKDLSNARLRSPRFIRFSTAHISNLASNQASGRANAIELSSTRAIDTAIARSTMKQ